MEATESEAVADLAETLEALGWSVVREPDASGPHSDLSAQTPGGSTVLIDVHSRSRVDPGNVLALRNTSIPSERVSVLVADRIPVAAREALTDSGMSWFDRRGHLRLLAPGVFVDSDVLPMHRVIPRSDEGIKGRAGIAYSVAVLLSPTKSPTIRGVARESGLSAPSISVAAASLRRAALVDAQGHPLLPDLFWTLAEKWRPDFMALGGNLQTFLERHSERLAVFGEPTTSGWALTGTAGANAWEAPLVAPADVPPSFYVPDSRTLSVARRVLGESDQEGRTCSLAVAPTPAACVPRVDLRTAAAAGFGHVLCTRPLFIALELAADQARGREILDGWTPADGSRVSGDETPVVDLVGADLR